MKRSTTKEFLQFRAPHAPGVFSKIIAVVGPTASGKTALAIRLAKKISARGGSAFGGQWRGAEIVSADSRQVYRGMDIGSGKIPQDRKRHKTQTSQNTNSKKLGRYIAEGIAHHLIDIASPKRQFTVAQFQKLAQKAIRDILQRGKLPIVCGGTGHYVDALIFGQQFPRIGPNRKLRAKLAKKPIAELYRMLKKLDPRRARAIDAKNPRRLIRALEIVLTTGKPVPINIPRAQLENFPYNILWLGLNPAREKLYRNIHKRLLARMRQGMVEEVRRLKKYGVSSRRLEAFGLEYRYINRHLEHRLSKKEMLAQLEREIRRYAKRQYTWFKRNKKIRWIKTGGNGNALTRKFLNR